MIIKLRPRQRAIVRMIIAEKGDVKEVARQLNSIVAGIKTDLNRVRRTLRVKSTIDVVMLVLRNEKLLCYVYGVKHGN